MIQREYIFNMDQNSQELKQLFTNLKKEYQIESNHKIL